MIEDHMGASTSVKSTLQWIIHKDKKNCVSIVFVLSLCMGKTTNKCKVCRICCWTYIP